MAGITTIPVTPAFTNLSSWHGKITCYEQLHSIYTYTKNNGNGGTTLAAFPNARTVRSGILLICKPGPKCNPKLLLVKEKEGVYKTRNGEKLFPVRFGPPKGAAKAEDRTALETAERELYEETKININKVPRARLLLSSLVYYRPEVNEVLVYFIVFVDHQPPVQICDKELAGYAWVDMAGGLARIQNVSTPTGKVFGILDSRGVCNHDVRVNTVTCRQRRVLVKTSV
jgi:8-oxo-dGTP pyrophosphatase MutT (NUDIX family)